MPVEYAVQLPCEVRRKVPEPQLRAMIRYKDLALFAIHKYREMEPGIDDDTLFNQRSVQIGVNGPDGTARQTPVPIAALVKMVAPLDELQVHCGQCPANSGRSFGCYSTIGYPIDRATEKWLLALLPSDENDPTLALLLKFLDDLEIDGAPVDAQRSRQNLFEAALPAFRTWGSGTSKKRISSSQLIHMLVFGGSLGAAQTVLYTRLLGLKSARPECDPGAERIAQFDAFLDACVLAGELRANVVVDF